MPGMPPKQACFAAAYVANGGNSAAAAATAGYVQANATDLLRKPKVQALIAELASKAARKYDLTVELAAANIYREMTFDPACLFNTDGTAKSIHELSPDTRMALAGVEVDGNIVRYKWASKSAARGDLMKHLGMFERDNAQKGESLSLLIKLV